MNLKIDKGLRKKLNFKNHPMYMKIYLKLLSQSVYQKYIWKDSMKKKN